ncbi:hypothetical protein KY290_037309 [Solanum tuberosum]|uniref:DOG1 domain-containing protein n=1 Tax=Solanum tuberosum TaxID=4113 RepID=A0ABQ7TX16_SOLTU|nr:hypothetical protein KY285_036605 [Solanum tuberosum]KAH0738604.1 hypothetical protein KY290_037309 [Solanum tuberosum]
MRDAFGEGKGRIQVMRGLRREREGKLKFLLRIELLLTLGLVKLGTTEGEEEMFYGSTTHCFKADSYLVMIVYINFLWNILGISSKSIHGFTGSVEPMLQGRTIHMCERADNLRQQTLQQMHHILTTRQSARALLAITDYFSRLRALSSLWLARPLE